ncbi:MAG TPA: CHAD domain-containing protein [Candidatus Limnocylindrales bacterium]
MASGHKIEVELKYEVQAVGSADRYLVAPEIGPFKPAGQVGSVQLEDRYVDSRDWTLARAGFAARLRRTSHGTRVCLKTHTPASGRLHRREELEGPANAAHPPTAWPASQARSVILELCGDEPLIELLTLRQLRRVRRFEAANTRVELSVDEVTVESHDRELDHFEELEIELKRGSEEPLEALADVLDREGGLQRVSRSKLDRAVNAVRTALAALPQEARQRWESAPPDLLGQGTRALPAASAGPVLAAVDATPGDSGGRPSPEPAEPAEPTEAEQAGAEQAGAEQAPDLAAAAPAKSGGPRALGVKADDPMPEAACKVLRFNFDRLLKWEAAVRSDSDIEALHDMRVATRRMRAAWRMFDDSFRASRTRKLRRRLEKVADGLGAVRDLDVLIDGLETYRSGLDADDWPGLAPLLSSWRRQRKAARTLLLDELDSPGYASFAKDMEEFLSGSASSASVAATPSQPRRVKDCAPSLLWAAYEAVRAYELVLPWASVETVHDLRIASKWLRYGLEFFGETLGPDGPRLLQRVVALQDHLGCLHDADVAAKLARDVLVARAGELSRSEAEAIGAYMHANERELARRRRTLGPVWRAVKGATFRRALGRATAAL